MINSLLNPWSDGDVTEFITATKLVLYNMPRIVCKKVKVQNEKAEIDSELQLNQSAPSEVCIYTSTVVRAGAKFPWVSF